MLRKITPFIRGPFKLDWNLSSWMRFIIYCKNGTVFFILKVIINWTQNVPLFLSQIESGSRSLLAPLMFNPFTLVECSIILYGHHIITSSSSSSIKRELHNTFRSIIAIVSPQPLITCNVHGAASFTCLATAPSCLLVCLPARLSRPMPMQSTNSSSNGPWTGKCSAV